MADGAGDEACEPADATREVTGYAESGASGWALLWAPTFALAGYAVEVVNGLRTHALSWAVTGIVLLALTALWVRARRRFLTVRVGDRHLRQGTELLPLARVAVVDPPPPGHGSEPDGAGRAGGHRSGTGTVGRWAEPAPPGTRVLGGGLSVPRQYAEVPLRLDDGTWVLAWARDGDALRRALRAAVKDSPT